MNLLPQDFLRMKNATEVIFYTSVTFFEKDWHKALHSFTNHIQPHSLQKQNGRSMEEHTTGNQRLVRSVSRYFFTHNHEQSKIDELGIYTSQNLQPKPNLEANYFIHDIWWSQHRTIFPIVGYILIMSKNWKSLSNKIHPIPIIHCWWFDYWTIGYFKTINWTN